MRAHTFAFDPDFGRILMFGGVGKDDGDYHNDLWALSGPTWTLLDSG